MHITCNLLVREFSRYLVFSRLTVSKYHYIRYLPELPHFDFIDLLLN